MQPMKSVKSNGIDIVHSSGIAHVFLTRGEQGNALCAKSVAELLKQLHQAMNKRGTRAVVLRQKGRDFCVGLDIDDHAKAATMAMEFTDALSLLHNAPLLTVAYVEGAAHGAGMGLAAACDIVIAGPNATFALPETRNGQIPALIMPTLIKRMPIGRAKTLALGLRTLDADAAMAMGLVDMIGNEKVLYDQLQSLMGAAPELITGVKSYLNDLTECPPDVHGELAVHAFTKALTKRPRAR